MFEKQNSLKSPRMLEVLVHAVTWLLIFGFPLVVMDYSSFIRWNGMNYLRHLRTPLAFGIVFYFNYAWLISAYLFKKGWKKFIFYNILLILAVSVLQYFSHGWVYADMTRRYVPTNFVPDGRFIFARFMFYIRDVIMLAFMAALAVVVRMGREWQNAEAARREAESARTDAELKTLRHQLSPHFLLNTLNNIYALISFDSDKAQHAVLELSKMLRHMLYDNQQKFVPLQNEADFIHNYVELMRLRLSREVKVDVDIQVDTEKQVMIAPLIFISLIENAFKHGISPTDPSFVSIKLSEEDGWVYGVIRNSNYPKKVTDKSGSGIGLEQVKRRLELLYPKNHEWKYGTCNGDKEYVSELKICTKFQEL
ncbi:MAG: histidine kinase [Bacteroidaceae bacterium]|nr:histidine kinase [Bacteroidaceae bacterium]